MNIIFNSPEVLWHKALVELLQKVTAYMEERITVSHDVFYMDDNDKTDPILNEEAETLCVAKILNGDLHRITHVNLHHNLRKNDNCTFVTIDFRVWEGEGKNSNDEDAYPEISDLHFSYDLLNDIAVYDEIINWINDGKITPSIFTSHPTKRN